jgi:hypothetical protein
MSTDVSEVRAASIIRARQYIPEDSELHTRRRENLKPHKELHGSAYSDSLALLKCELRKGCYIFPREKEK